MISTPRLTNALPANAAVHVRLSWHRGLLGLPVPAPRIVIDNRH
jgi:hypothetical protein